MNGRVSGRARSAYAVEAFAAGAPLRLGVSHGPDIEVDPRDEAGLRAFHDTEQAAIRHDRPDAVIRTWPALLTLAQTPSPYYRRTFLAAVDDGRTVGVADLGGSVRDNEHLADLEINVLADHRRRGLGRALWEEADRRRRADGRTSVCGEVCVPAGVTPDTSPAYAFAEAMGFSTVHRRTSWSSDCPSTWGTSRQ